MNSDETIIEIVLSQKVSPDLMHKLQTAYKEFQNTDLEVLASTTQLTLVDKEEEQVTCSKIIHNSKIDTGSYTSFEPILSDLKGSEHQGEISKMESIPDELMEMFEVLDLE